MLEKDDEERLSKLEHLETSCQELKVLIRAANKENQQLKMDLEIQGIKSSRKDKRIKELEQKVQAAKLRAVATPNRPIWVFICRW